MMNLLNNTKFWSIVVGIALIASVVAVYMYKFNPGVWFRPGQAILIETSLEESVVKEKLSGVDTYKWEKVASRSWLISGKQFDTEVINKLAEEMLALDTESNVQQYNYSTNRFAGVGQRLSTFAVISVAFVGIYIAAMLKGVKQTRGEVLVFFISLVKIWAATFILYIGLSALLSEYLGLVTDSIYVTVTGLTLLLTAVYWLTLVVQFKIFLTDSHIDSLARSWQVFIDRELTTSKNLIVPILAPIAYLIIVAKGAEFNLSLLLLIIMTIMQVAASKYTMSKVIDWFTSLQKNSKIAKSFFAKEWK